MNLRELNKAKIEELEPRVRYAATALEEEAWNNGLPMEILEAYRTQERQNQLYAQGRKKEGTIVTWTKDSFHTKRLAIDVRPYAEDIPRFYQRIAEMAKKYGITAPLQKAPYYDMGHLQFDNVPPKPIATTGKIVQKRTLERLKRKIVELSPEIAKRFIRRINAKFGTSITL